MFRNLTSLVGIVNRVIARRKIQQLNDQKAEAFQHFDKNQEKLLTLLKAVLKNHNYLSNVNDTREVADDNSKIYIKDCLNNSDTHIVLRNSQGIYLEFYVEKEKAFLFKEEFDKVSKRKSLVDKIEKKKELGKFLDDLIEIEKKELE